jgi:hypothetical protein
MHICPDACNIGDKMLTEEQWKTDANARAEFEAHLNTPVVINAFAITEKHGLEPIVLAPGTVPPGIDLIQYGAMKAFYRDGYFAALDKLRSLAKITRRESPRQKPWTVDPKSMPPEKFADDIEKEKKEAEAKPAP